MQISTVPLGRDTPYRPDPQLKLRAILKRADGANPGSRRAATDPSPQFQLRAILKRARGANADSRGAATEPSPQFQLRVGEFVGHESQRDG